MADRDRPDPFRNFRFKVEIDGIENGWFSEASGFDVSVDMAEYRAGDDPVRTKRKLPGLAKYSNITLKRGVTTDMSIYNWAVKIPTTGECERKTVTLKLMDINGDSEVAVWQVVQAWPVKYSVTEFKGQGNEVVFESLELAHEGMTKTK